MCADVAIVGPVVELVKSIVKLCIAVSGHTTIVEHIFKMVHVPPRPRALGPYCNTSESTVQPLGVAKCT